MSDDLKALNRDAVGKMVFAGAEQLLNMGAVLAATSTGLCQVLAGSYEDSKAHGCVVCIIAGKVSENDMRRFRDFCESFNQDIQTGGKCAYRVREDKLGAEESGEAKPQ